MVLTNGAIPKAALLAHVLQSRQHDIWTYRTASSWTGGDGMARLPVPSEKNEQGPPPGPSMSISLEIASHRRCQCPAAGSDHLLAGEAGGRQCRSAKEPPERVIEFWPARRLTSGRRVATKAGRYAPKRMRGERSHVGQQGQSGCDGDGGGIGRGCWKGRRASSDARVGGAVASRRLVKKAEQP